MEVSIIRIMRSNRIALCSAAVSAHCLFSVMTVNSTAAAKRIGADESSHVQHFMHDPDLQLYLTPSRACGVPAAYIALAWMGHTVSVDTLARELPVASTGTSMADLASLFESYGLVTQAVEIDINGLNKALHDSPDCCAIAWVDNDHWVTVMTGRASDFCYYEYPRWYDSQIEGLNERFSGRALILTAQGSTNTLRLSYWIRLGSCLLAIANFGLLLGILGFSVRRRFRQCNKED